MSQATYLIGDVFDVLAGIPDRSVDLILTSPPFLALRSYLPDGHPDKAKEIGSEPDPAAFIDTMLALTAEWRRVLAPHGTLAVELGDTYSGVGGSSTATNPAYGTTDRALAHKAAQPAGSGKGWRKASDLKNWPEAKSLALIPESYRLALAYGRNPLTGAPSPAGRWKVRNVIRWVRPNPPVGALGDKFRPATSEMVIACTSSKRWFDLDAVRTDHKYDPTKTTGNGYTKGRPEGEGHGTVAMPSNPAGAPPLDWWDIIEAMLVATAGRPERERASLVRDALESLYGPGDAWEIAGGGYTGSHYAVYPPELCVRPIKAMCPAEVCRTCGEPRRRIVEKDPRYAAFREVQNERYAKRDNSRLGVREASGSPGGWDNRTATINEAAYVTVGWTDCGHGDYRPGVVLDPFAGSGTTLMVATGHGRDAIGIDLDERNADLARDRIGMFLTVTDTRTPR